MTSQVKIVTPGPDARVGVPTSSGTRLFVGGVEIEELVDVKYEVDFRLESAVRSTVTFTFIGTVDFEFSEPRTRRRERG